MIVPKDNLRTSRAGQTNSGWRRFLRTLLLSCLIVIIGWTLWVYSQIQAYGDRDEARPADAIAVFGAAEYDGRPSPVLRARLDHALTLYQEKLAPLIITLGGGDPADRHSEGGVGHDYLIAHGVPEANIIAETQSNNTEESAARLAVIARKNHLTRIVAVSDDTHLFRIHALCERLGLVVHTSPRPVNRSISRTEAFKRIAHEILSYTFWRIRAH